MVDISMCNGDNCEIKQKCYRYTAQSDSHWQTIFMPQNPGKDCEHFYDNKGKRNVR